MSHSVSNPDARQLATQVRKSLGIGTNSTWTSARLTQKVLLEAVMRRAGYGDLDVRLDAAAYGLAWAVETGRVSGTVALQIRDLSPYQYAKLLGEVAAECAVVRGVPRFLYGRFRD
jgi:hypothetical protein